MTNNVNLNGSLYYAPVYAPAPPAPAEPDVSAGAVSMSPQALMMYCSSCVGSLDTQMNTIFQQQQQDNSYQNIVAQAATALQQYQSSGIGSSGHPDNATCEKLEASLYAAYEQANGMDPNSSLTQGLANIYNQVMASG